MAGWTRVSTAGKLVEAVQGRAPNQIDLYLVYGTAGT